MHERVNARHINRDAKLLFRQKMAHFGRKSWPQQSEAIALFDDDPVPPTAGTCQIVERKCSKAYGLQGTLTLSETYSGFVKL
jgi:hypothetical protein